MSARKIDVLSLYKRSPYVVFIFKAYTRERTLQLLRSRESQLDEKGNIFSMNAEWM